MKFDMKEIESELPKISKFEDRDVALIKDVIQVFEKYGFTGRVKAIEFECGFPPPSDRPEQICFRVCVPGHDDRPLCRWICY